MRRGNKPLHPVKWYCEGAKDASLTTEGTSVVEILDSDTFEALQQPTIMRIRGDIVLTLTRNSSDNTQSIRYAMGLIMLPEGQSTANSILTDPENAEASFLWLKAGLLIANTVDMPTYNGSGVVEVTNNEQTYGLERISVDVRAKRRVRPNERLALLISWDTPNNDPDLAYWVFLRTLVQE